MFRYMDLLEPYGQYWFVTITPYGKDIEPNVPEKDFVMDVFCKLSDIIGIHSIGWRYDPILINDYWTVDRQSLLDQVSQDVLAEKPGLDPNAVNKNMTAEQLCPEGSVITQLPSWSRGLRARPHGSALFIHFLSNDF